TTSPLNSPALYWSAVASVFLSMIVGIALILDLRLTHHEVGYILLIFPGLILVSVFVARVVRSSLRFPRKRSSSDKNQQINEAYRQRIAIEATQVARRIRYIETRSVSSEGSASWRGLGI